LAGKRRQLVANIGPAASRRGQMLLGQIMSTAPECVGQETSVLELVRRIRAHHFRHLLVTDELGRLCGVVSDRDVLRCFGPGQFPDQELLAGIPARQIMSTDLITATAETAVSTALAIMVEHGISCLPILAAERLVGIVTNTDLHLALERLLQVLSDLAACEPTGTPIRLS